MTNSVYISSKKKARAIKHEFITEFSKKKSEITKISKRKARKPVSKSFRTNDEIVKIYLEILKKQSINIIKDEVIFQ